jgi:hypothetical protein
MPFLLFTMKRGNDTYEWGFHSDLVPSVGDTIQLQVNPPNEPQPEGEMLRCVIISREWYFGHYYETGDYQEDSVDFEVASNDPIPEGHIADSEEWPSETEHVREAEFQAHLKKIIQGGVESA